MMRARDIMTAAVLTVAPDADVADAARILLDNRISALPVVDTGGKLVGIVSEGDLMRRAEAGTQRQPSWWLSLLTTTEERAQSFVRSHGRRVGDVMTADVVTVAETTPIDEIAEILEARGIKRVPVTREGRVVGIVSRADLLHGIVAARAGPAHPTDEAIKDAVLAALGQAGVGQRLLNVVVAQGVVRIWGIVDTPAEKEAVRVAADVAGARQIEINVQTLPRGHRAVLWPD
jgi:CBS domain-containing protein